MLTETARFPYYKQNEEKYKRKRSFSIKLKTPSIGKNPVLLKMFPPTGQSLDLHKKKVGSFKNSNDD